MTGEPIREMRLDVRPGLYALRYVGSVDVRTAPSALVKPVVASAGVVEIITAPGAEPGHLGAPGSSVVIVASAPGAVEITLTPFGSTQNLDARFTLDLLASAEPTRQPRPAAALGPGQAEPTIDLMAHVSRRGDVMADEEGWIAGPRSPSAIEALQIQVRGRDLGVAAQFRNVEARSSWSAWVTPGALVGVPRKACPLTAVRLKLVGADAERYELAGEALFLGAPRASAKGGEIEFVSPGELDPLIGFKLSLLGRATSVPSAPPEKASRVRVFR